MPLATLGLSLAVAAFFYRLLPSQTAYHFADSVADKWADRTLVLTVLLVPQLVFTIIAAVLVWGMAVFSWRFPESNGPLVSRLLAIMGNMVGLPQMVLLFAMTGIFSYNAYGVDPVPFLIWALVFMGIGTVVLIVLFTRAVRRASQSIGR